ncbi:MAG: Hsp70 family protein [Polyangiaceae bacterium]
MTVVGIDLGTTNTVVGVVQEGQATALSDEHGDRLLPSVVSFHPSGNVLVGRAAKERRQVDAKNTIYSVKRLIGRSWDSEEVRQARSRFAFEMREGPGQATLVVARGETYTLPEISAFVLRRAKAIADAATGSSVERAVITVPANFNDLQRAATKVAGRVAGIEVLRILNEPTAAALAYGYGKSANERIAVYDFGGGTFDVTLLDLSENVFEVLATAGNTFLGGDDVDLAIADRMAEAFLREHRLDPRDDPQAFEKLRAAAEVLKARLSNEGVATLNIPEVAHGVRGQSLDFTFGMTRSELEALAAPFVDQTFEVCREALDIARLKPDDFDQVLLVGGSTRIPLVRTRVEEFFRRPVLGHISPDEVVAIGAAIQAAALTGTERRRGDIPAAPSRPSAPAPCRRRGHLPPGRPRPDGFQPNTQPYGPPRGRIPTAPGLNDEARDVAPARRPVVVPSPGAPVSAAPHTADQGGGRPRAITGTGLGPAPSRRQPQLLAWARGDACLPAPAWAHAAARAGASINTLMSAGAAADKAKASTEKRQTSPRGKLPSIVDAGMELPLVESGRPPENTQPLAAVSPPEPEDVTAESRAVAEELARRSRPGRPPVSTLTSEAEKRSAPPVYQLDEADLMDDASNLFTVSPDTEQIHAYAAPASTDEVTEVARKRTGASTNADLRRTGTATDTQTKRRTGSVVDQMLLPVPEIPDDEDTTTNAIQGIPPAAFGQTLGLGSPTAAEVPGLFDAGPSPSPPLVTAPMPQAPVPQPQAAMPRAPLPQAPPPWSPEAAAAAAPAVMSPAAYAPAPAAHAHAPAPFVPAHAPAPFVPAHAPAPFVPAPMAQAPRIQDMPVGGTPLLVDVTPLSLLLETVGGYCDTIITRNTPVPCEETRNFATAMDNQTSVRIRVAQGESNHFSDNALLGEVELSGLAPAPRGATSIAVTFALDTDGLLNVRARDVASGREAHAAVRLVAVPHAGEVASMTQRQAHYNVTG